MMHEAGEPAIGETEEAKALRLNEHLEGYDWKRLGKEFAIGRLMPVLPTSRLSAWQAK